MQDIFKDLYNNVIINMNHSWDFS